MPAPADLTGKTLNQYKVLRKVGSGGMGDVWVAEDTRLKRQVALKTLPVSMAADPERRARFEREARSIASLNHPNIVTIHSVEEAEGIHFLAMELVEGETVTQLIPKGGCDPSRFFELAVPLADAVAAAHEQGITHRDLKPDNIMVTKEGRVKVLDFGLAKLRDDAFAHREDSEDTSLETVAHKTEEGRIMGTVAYMSPEQAEAKPVDHRSDIFSLGVVFYEMATGVRPFQGDTQISTISSILRDTPRPVSDINRNLPRHLGRIVRRCLAKDPGRRIQSALDLRNELEELKAEIGSGLDFETGGGPQARPRSTLMPGLIAGVFVAVVILVAGWFLLPGRSESRPAGSSPVAVPFTPTFTQLTSQPGVEHYVTLSPNGRNFAYASDSGGNFDIFVQRVGGRNPINLTETCAEDDTMPSFSPDGESIVFRSQCEGGGLFVMGATGESIRRLTDMGYNPSWSPDGSRVLFTEAIFNVPQSRSGSRSRLMTVDVASREVRTILDADSVQASFSPNGHRIAYWGLPVDGGGQRDIYTVSADGKDIVPVTQDTALDWSPVWSPDGRFLYYSSDHGGAMNIWRVPIDEKTGETFGPPQPVTAGVTSWSQHLSISADGRRLAYVSETRYSDMYRISYDPETRSVVGLPERLDAASRLTVGGCTPAPDGEWLACAKRDPVEDIIIVRSDGSDRRQLTDDGHKDRYPVWSRDGSKILFYSDRTGKYDAWTINRDGSGLEQVTHAAGDTLFPTWSPDGKSLTYADFDNWKTYMIDPGRPWTDQTPQSLDLVKDGHTIAVQSWSPDSTKVAGVTYKNQTTSGMGAFDLAAGEFKLFLPYPSQPWWMPDNHTLLYADQRTLSLVDSDTGETHRLLKMDNIDPFSPRVSPDGRTLYFAGGPLEADIWLMEIED